MRLSTIFSCAFLIVTSSIFAQVPTPMSTSSPSYPGAYWTKTTTTDFVLRNKSGARLSNVMDLVYLKTETLPVLDKNARTIYLLIDFKNASIGDTGDASILKKNVGKNFFITNPHSFGHYVNDKYYSGIFCNINKSYVYYLEEENATFYLKDIRKFSDWGAGTSKKLAYSASNTYWYRDVAEGEFGIIEKGETLDYDRVDSEKEGDDLIVKWDGLRTYVLPGYYTSASFVFKPVQAYSSSASTSSTTSVDCVKGDCQNGWGKYEYDNGHYYGFWKNGKKDGYGLYKWTDTGKYIGNWDNDMMSGYGVYIAENEDNIIGQYSDGQLNGYGITVTGDVWQQGIYLDGNLTTSYDFITNTVDTGCTAGDCQNKYGRFKWSNGDSFTGFFKNGNMYMGTYKFADGGKYSGMFNNDNKFHGMGRYFFKDDAYYGGNWRNGKYHGRGYYHNENLVKQIGEWSNGTLVKSMK
ncbi:MAG: hypothetical protein O6943_07580 [Bacteroidetes bacterium]|nr:hypothetical protein [Bacteroidota bacterium]